MSYSCNNILSLCEKKLFFMSEGLSAITQKNKIKSALTKFIKKHDDRNWTRFQTNLFLIFFSLWFCADLALLAHA